MIPSDGGHRVGRWTKRRRARERRGRRRHRELGLVAYGARQNHRRDRSPTNLVVEVFLNLHDKLPNVVTTVWVLERQRDILLGPLVCPHNQCL